jgi:hypothetical protein
LSFIPPIDLSLASGPPRLSELSVRLTRVSLSDSQVDGERGLGHHLGIDADHWAQRADVAVDSRVQVNGRSGGGDGFRGESVGVRLRGAGGGL